MQTPTHNFFAEMRNNRDFSNKNFATGKKESFVNGDLIFLRVVSFLEFKIKILYKMIKYYISI